MKFSENFFTNNLVGPTRVDQRQVVRRGNVAFGNDIAIFKLFLFYFHIQLINSIR